MSTEAEIQSIASRLCLSLDSPESVKQQIKQIALAQKELRVIKKGLAVSVKSINTAASQASPDSFFSVVSDITGHRKDAGTLRAIKRKRIQQNKLVARQPYVNLQQVIEQLILKGDQLKLLGEQYIQDPVGVKARIQAEEEQKRLEAEMRLAEEKRLAEDRRLAEEHRQRQIRSAIEKMKVVLPKVVLPFSGALALLVVVSLLIPHSSSPPPVTTSLPPSAPTPSPVPDPSPQSVPVPTKQPEVTKQAETEYDPTQWNILIPGVSNSFWGIRYDPNDVKVEGHILYLSQTKANQVVRVLYDCTRLRYREIAYQNSTFNSVTGASVKGDWKWTSPAPTWSSDAAKDVKQVCSSLKVK